MHDCFNSLLIICLIAVILYGCGPIVTDRALGDKEIDRTEILEAAQRGEAKKLLGTPDKIENWEGRRIEAYSVYKGSRMFSPMYPIIPALIPIDADFSHIIIAYDNDGSFIEIQELTDDTADSAIMSYKEFVVDLASCEIPFAEAQFLSEQILFEKYLLCARGSLGRTVSEKP